MDDSEAPQFGTPVSGRAYRDRPGAYAVVLVEDRLLVVATPNGLYLPGGGVVAGETAEQTLRREVFEETGRRIVSLNELGRARQYVRAPFNKVETFFVVGLDDGEVDAGSEPDHRPCWVNAEDAVAGLVEEAQRWAVRRHLAAIPE